MAPEKRAKRHFTPEQKFQILRDIEADINGGMKVGDALIKQNISYSNYAKWKRQLSVGVKSSLRNGKAPADRDKRRLEREIERLREVVLSQAQALADLKKETNWD
jgi:transposase-like protein